MKQQKSCLLIFKVYMRSRFSFETYVKNIREKATKCSLKTIEVVLDTGGPFVCLSLIFILIFFKKMFCLMSGLKLTLIDVTSFLPGNLSGLQKKLYSCLLSVIFQVSTPRCAMQCFDTFQYININRKHNILN